VEADIFVCPSGYSPFLPSRTEMAVIAMPASSFFFISFEALKGWSFAYAHCSPMRPENRSKEKFFF